MGNHVWFIKDFLSYLVGGSDFLQELSSHDSCVGTAVDNALCADSLNLDFHIMWLTTAVLDSDNTNAITLI